MADASSTPAAEDAAESAGPATATARATATAAAPPPAEMTRREFFPWVGAAWAVFVASFAATLW